MTTTVLADGAHDVRDADGTHDTHDGVAPPPRRARRARVPFGVAVAGVGLGLVVLAALLPEQLAPADPLHVEAGATLLPPGPEHWLGTDENGRDLLSRIIHGARNSLFLGFGAIAIALVGGTVLGLLAGLGPRWLDHVPTGGASGVMCLRRAARAVQAGDASVVACVGADTNHVNSFRLTLGSFSNFARDGFACRHNIGCWTRVPYLGFGCAAHSFFDECRVMNPPTLDAYLAGAEPTTQRLSKEDARFESLMLGLRMTRGVSDHDFARMHGLTIREAFGEKLDKPLTAGLLEWHEGALRLTRLGMDLQNSVLVDLM